MGAGGLTPAAAAERLVAAAARDLAVRNALAARGALQQGYCPEMRAVHEANADLLESVMALFAWPGPDRFGDDAAEAAWLVVQHAIGRPQLQRAALAMMRQAGAAARQCAMLEDRIAFFEGQPQRFGTQFDWNDAGELVPWRLADPDRVDAMRAEVGLEPLAEHAAALAASGLSAPRDLERHRREGAQWLIAAGWRLG